MMMMMIMTLMKLVNSTTNFRHGMDKFYQPNSGLGSSRSLQRPINTKKMYTYMCVSCDFLMFSRNHIQKAEVQF